jgi:hypothetical protein
LLLLLDLLDELLLQGGKLRLLLRGRERLDARAVEELLPLDEELLFLLWRQRECRLSWRARRRHALQLRRRAWSQRGREHATGMRHVGADRRADGRGRATLHL